MEYNVILLHINILKIFLNKFYYKERKSVMNKIWGWMIIISILIGMFRGLAPEMVNTIFDATKSATENSINIIGMICLWSGIMKVAESCGVVEKISVIVEPILKILFPKLKKESEARGAIALNMTANLLGLGNIATPLGLKAMEKLQEDNIDKNTLTDDMMMLIVINTASIQLIPTSIIALRVSHNSKNPVNVVIPILIASLVSVLTGIILVKLKRRKS